MGQPIISQHKNSNLTILSLALYLKPMTERPSWEEYALQLAEVAAKRSKDPWVKVGCCLLRHDNSVASLGYNGMPAGVVEDWIDRDARRLTVIHSEMNALRYVRPGECYLAAITMTPCNDCLKNLVSYGIKNIVYRTVYSRDTSCFALADKFGVQLIQLPTVTSSPSIT
jgi:dCMP deaminase